jgi:TolA-binding protein
MFRSLSLCIILLVPGLASAASKEVQLLQELQRDVATLGDTVKNMQKAQDDKIKELSVLVEQSLKSSNDAVKAVSGIQSALQQSMREQESKVTTPVVNLSRQMDSMSKDFGALSGYVTELQRTVNEMKSQLSDMNDRLKLMQMPTAAPPPAPGAGAEPSAGAAPAADASTASSCGDLLASADGDRQGARNELALRGYTDYLKSCANRPDAARAQYYVGALHFAKKDYKNAVEDFDALLEKYPDDNPLRPKAFYYKGMSLVNLGRKTEARAEFDALIKEFPKDPLAVDARDQLKNLGYNPPRTAPASKSTKKR